MSSACFPSSVTMPWRITQILSALTIVDRRWAMTIQVRPSRALSKASCTTWRIKDMNKNRALYLHAAKTSQVNEVWELHNTQQHMHSTLHETSRTQKYSLFFSPFRSLCPKQMLLHPEARCEGCGPMHVLWLSAASALHWVEPLYLQLAFHSPKHGNWHVCTTDTEISQEKKAKLWHKTYWN